MSDEKKPPDRKDRTHVNLDDANEVVHWCYELRCTDSQLRDAVARVGTLAMRVRAFLGRDF